MVQSPDENGFALASYRISATDLMNHVNVGRARSLEHRLVTRGGTMEGVIRWIIRHISFCFKNNT